MYSQLHAAQPGFTKKVHPIHGDVLEENFGMSEKDTELLKTTVNVVFHAAATVRFDEPLR